MNNTQLLQTENNGKTIITVRARCDENCEWYPIEQFTHTDSAIAYEAAKNLAELLENDKAERLRYIEMFIN